jgi:hypothetical protein
MLHQVAFPEVDRDFGLRTPPDYMLSMGMVLSKEEQMNSKFESKFEHDSFTIKSAISGAVIF